MEKYLNKIMIIDGSYMLHRSLKSPGLQDLCTTDGKKSGGVFGFLNSMQKELRKFSSYFPIVCWDKGLSERRTSLYQDYKANRKRNEADNLIALGLSEEDDYLYEYRRQRSDLINILKSFGIPSLILPGWEGDDLQYLLTKVCEEGVVVSDDKDLIQLVSPNIKIRRAMVDETIEFESCDDYYKHPRFTIRKSIVGDGSDNIPKCAQGLGDKGADEIATMIQDLQFEEYKPFLEKSSENLDLSKSLRTKIKKLLDNWDQFVINYNLIDLRLVTPPVGFEMMVKDLLTLTIGKGNIMESYKLLGSYEMTRIYPDQIISLIALSSSQVLKRKENQ